MRTNAGDTIQGIPLGRGDATSPYTVQDLDRVVEFITAGTVTCALETGGPTTTTILAGSRYAIGCGVTTITFSGTFNIG